MLPTRGSANEKEKKEGRKKERERRGKKRKVRKRKKSLKCYSLQAQMKGDKQTTN